MRRSCAIEPVRAVIDTNIFVSAALNLSGPPGRVVTYALDGRFVMVSTDRHERELRHVMERSSVRGRVPVDRNLLTTVLEFLRTVDLVLDPPPLAVSCRDPKDDYLLACAVAGKAHYLVTGDRDLLALDGDPALGALRILTPLDFLAALDARHAAE